MSAPTKLIRTLYPKVRVVDSAKGIVDYVASDETLDSWKEVIRADGWRFTHFRKNAPFVDSHEYDTIANQVGRVIDFHVERRQLVERVQWAVDVPENQLAQLGWRMTEAGYLKAVSVGFWPTRYASKWDNDKSAWLQQLQELNLHEESGVRTIYIEQEQVELSACIIGANPNALAKAYKAGAIGEAELETFSREYAKRETATATERPADVAVAQQRARTAFLLEFTQKVNHL
jgi:hypothetical protein